jgi:hypothetical protein
MIPDLQLQIVPVGETKMAPVDALMQQGKRPASMGGIDLSAMGKTVTVYEARTKGPIQAAFAIRTPVGTKPEDPDPELVAETLVVACQEAACRFWCDRQKDCRQVASCEPGCSHDDDSNPAEEGQGDDEV